jgi:TRAP-type C4-dicarboxylate transport system, periplasmic component
MTPTRWRFKAAGADAANLSFKDVMPRLKDGSIVAVLSSGDGGAGRKLWEYLPNFTAVNYAVPLSFAFVQREAFEALPEADRKAVMEAAQETEARQWKAIEGRLERNYATMRANGVAIVTAAPADVSARLRTAASAVIDAWAAKAGDDGKAILAKARKP